MTVTPLQISPISRQPAPRFSGLSTALISVDKALQPIKSDRAREMLFEDFVGFGVLRSLIDLLRPIFFKSANPQESQLNPAAARERLIREAFSIITDNVSAGVFAYGLTRMADRGGKSFGNTFIARPSLELFQNLLKTSKTPEAFKSALVQAISPEKAEKLLAMFPTQGKLAGESAFKMAEELGLKSLDVTIGKGKTPYALKGLLEDSVQFLKVTKSTSPGWAGRAQQMVRNTLKLNSRVVPASLFLAAALTMGVAVANNALTRMIDGIESYPGELGLREARRVGQTKTWMERNLPYVDQCIKERKWLPLVVSMLPLPFAVGLVDTVKLARGELLGALVNPFKGFKGKWLNMYQFTKGFPFTTQQQMASLFALLITSRLLTSRSDIEYRERLVDSFAGWALWIIATPRIQTFLANRFDAKEKTQLMKKVGNSLMLKTRSEITRLIKNPVIRSRTLKRFAMINAGSTLITLLLMGLIEPIIAVKWSEKQAKSEQKPTTQPNPWAQSPVYRFNA